MLLLLHQIHDPHSFWAPYFKTLPKEWDTPLLWNEQDLNTLPRDISHEIARQREDYIQLYKTRVLAFLRNEGSELYDERIHTLEAYLYVIALMRSRTFHFSTMDGGPGYYAFIPWADLSNHSNIPKSLHQHEAQKEQKEADSESESEREESLFEALIALQEEEIGDKPVQRSAVYSLDDETGRFTFYANRSYNPGDEVFNSYGVGPCSEFLINYGFVAGEEATFAYPSEWLSRALATNITQTPAALEPDNEIANQKRALLEKLGQDDNVLTFTCQRTGVPADLMLVLSVLSLDKASVQQMTSNLSTEQEEEQQWDTTPLTQHANVRRALTLGISLVQELVDSYTIPLCDAENKRHQVAKQYAFAGEFL
eukprot:TRINITY_DN9822_c0_g1_i1.p1 TRINITY_DN9822_c0_g1~~TRINITY_DN9822_c0_g1_i1.p1  ORF type:complete len:368 (-),score=63.65 TRINITY_DN9822_c0_g1_i1:180-1283(-)